MATNSIDVTASAARNLIKRDVAESAQYLTFHLAGEQYGIDILKVQEIRGWTPVTQMPNAPAFVRGVMNLRGTIVPVIDLRLRFGLETVAYTKTTVVIVVTVDSASGSRIIGAVVDGVSDVLNVDEADIQPAPDFGTAVQTDFISGLVMVDANMAMLLDVDRLMSIEELFALETVRRSSAPFEVAEAELAA